jgi:beta-N-acetylhexosaminidase
MQVQELRSIGALRAILLALVLVAVGVATVIGVISGSEHKKPRRGEVVGLNGLHPRAQPPARTAPATKSPNEARRVPLERLVGQRIMVGFPGTSAPPSLLDNIRAGRVGGVILFSPNIQSDQQVRSLTSELQAAARGGGNPPLLISVDQEGGSIRRFASAPPDLSPPQMASSNDPSVAYNEGVKTGRHLAGLGVNVDLAPVVDVVSSPQSFIGRQGRSFGSDPEVVSTYAEQFVTGLKSAGVLATAKHFPGVGSATVDTDNKLQTIDPAPKDRDAALRPYRRLADSVDLVMLATGIFPAYDANSPAALSEPVNRLLREDVGFQGVTITDALESPTGQSPVQAGVTAARAGTDVLLYTDEAAGEFDALMNAARRGSLGRGSLEVSYERIVAAKRSLRG